MFEYVIWDNFDGCIHRGPWTEEECIEWMETSRELFSNGNIDEVWSIRRREIGAWETYDNQ